MRIKLAALATTLVCALGAFSVMSPAASATGVTPNICENECGGSWGAWQHSKYYAEDVHGLVYVAKEGCAKNSEHGAQWDCWGFGFNPYSGQQIWFHCWVSEYGYEQWYTSGPNKGD
jgi:hypothetical protein